MNADQLNRVKALHAEALAIDADERSDFLARACDGDAEVHREVESLLNARETMGGFMETPAAERVRRVVRAMLEPGARIGRYEIVSILGSGGGGTVYEAVQENPRRTVALKVMQSGVGAHRFRDEAQILARLQHPGIATVFEAGIHEDEFAWFAMEFNEGARPIQEQARDRRTQLTLIAQVCDAVHYGHQKGVFHRDIKPGNILVDRAGRPKVIDFGIAKLTGEEGSGAGFAGTLPYGNPNLGEPDARSDIYSLGVVLYELLTGRLPWDVAGDPFPEAVRKIRTQPVPPPGLGADIDAIVAQALAVDGYASAAALADDIRRYLTHRPVEARPAGALSVLGKFARRQRVAFTAISALVVVSIAAALIAGGLAIEKERQRADAEFSAYVANLAAAEAALRVDDVGEAHARLAETPAHLRNWEWRHLFGRLDASARTYSTGHRNFAGATSGDGVLWAAAGDETITVGKVASGEVVHRFAAENYVTSLALDARGERLAVGNGGKLGKGRGRGVVLLDPPTGAVLVRTQGHESDVNALRFDPRGDRLASASRDGTIRLWSTTDGSLLQTLRGHEGRVICIAFNEGQLASGGREGVIRIWGRGGERIAELRGHEGSVDGVAFSPDGAWLASCGRDRTVRLWNLSTHRLAATARGHHAAVVAVSFASRVATASYDRTIRLWDAQQLRAGGVLRGHTGHLKDVAFLPGGGLVSFALDRTVKVWPRGAGDAVPTLRGHEDRLLALALSDRHVASVAADGMVGLWDAATHRRLKLWRPHEQQTVSIRFHDNGSALRTRSVAGEFRDWSVPAGARLADPPAGLEWQAPPDPPSDPRLLCEAHSPDGTRRATGGSDGAVRLWDTAKNRQVLVLHGHRYGVRCLAFSPDGRRLASGGGIVEGKDSVIRLWEAE